jgi:hypothetical protein
VCYSSVKLVHIHSSARSSVAGWPPEARTAHPGDISVSYDSAKVCAKKFAVVFVPQSKIGPNYKLTNCQRGDMTGSCNDGTCCSKVCLQRRCALQ